MRKFLEEFFTTILVSMILGIILAFLLSACITFAAVPCDLTASELTWGPAQHACPTVTWDQMDEHIDGFRIYYWNSDEARGETWVYVPCWWYPDDEELYGDLAGTRFCHGEVVCLPRPLIRDIDFPAGIEISMCVTALRWGPDDRWWESENCSDQIDVCWPLIMRLGWE